MCDIGAAWGSARHGAFGVVSAVYPGGSSASAPLRHPREQALLSPGRRAGVEEGSARIEQTERVSGEDALSLISILQHDETLRS
jgi:hypothetical protein